MGLSGFILELLIPGLIAVLGGVLLLWELGVVDGSLSGDPTGAVLLAVLLVASYLVGAILRHVSVPLLKSSPQVYKDRLTQSWSDHLDALGLNAGSLTDEVVEKFVSRLRDALLRDSSDPWADYLMYQWNVARLARNSLIPIAWLITVLVTAAVNSSSQSNDHRTVPYLVAAVLSYAALPGLTRVYRDRMNWHLDIIVRTRLGPING